LIHINQSFIQLISFILIKKEILKYTEKAEYCEQIHFSTLKVQFRANLSFVGPIFDIQHAPSGLT